MDDNADIADSTADVLALIGLDARPCVSSAEALALAAAFRPHACVLDINMPVMNGCELATRLRELLGPVFLVAVTAAAGDELDRRLEAVGFDLWFVKPADPERLLAVLGREVGCRGGQAAGAESRPLARGGARLSRDPGE